ncbi:hypothetical protein [Niabella aquatica]
MATPATDITLAINTISKKAVTYEIVETHWDGSAMDDGKIDGVIYKKDGELYKKRCLTKDDYLTPEMFSATGNANYKNPSNNQLYIDSGYTTLATDDTEAFQNCITWAARLGLDIIIPQKKYLITNTLNFPYISLVEFKPYILRGTGSSVFTTLYFYNTTINTPMFSFATGAQGYFAIEGVELVNANVRTCTCFYFYDKISINSQPAHWKMRVFNCRVNQFKIGAHIAGASSYNDDAHTSEVLWLHNKFKNNETSFVYENIQSVNHQFIGTDSENDEIADISEKWKHFYFKRGTFVNHFGGSIIGAGPYLYIEVTGANDFQETSKFNSYGVRVEHRNSATPLIYHAETSSIVISNAFDVCIREMSVINSYTGSDEILFAKTGGCMNYHFENIMLNKVMYVRAAITSNVTMNYNLGRITIKDSPRLTYKRYIPSSPEYGSAGMASNMQVDIPTENDFRAFRNILTSTNDVINPVNYTTNQYQPGFGGVAAKQMVYKPVYNTGIWSGIDPGELKVKMPIGTWPYKVIIIRNAFNMEIAATFSIEAITTAGVKELGVLSATNKGGCIEIPLTLPIDKSMNSLLVDETVWDGTLNIKRTGNTHSFIGMIIIEYL